MNYTDETIAIADANGAKVDKNKSKLQLDNWMFAIDPQQDWQEMFDDAWRMMRDYFYDRDLHKVNWIAIKQQYEPLMPLWHYRWLLYNLRRLSLPERLNCGA